jgi:hypothetical protein
MTDSQTCELTIEFIGVKDNEAVAKADRLRSELKRKSPGISINQLAADRGQSAGLILAVTLGPPMVLAVAAALEAFICQDNTRIRVSSETESLFEGARKEASELKAALTTAVAARQ